MRRGKYILAHLSNRRTLITHLRMTGRFIYLNHDAEHTPHTSAVLWFDGGKKLLFDDQRHFGLMMVARTDELERVKHLAKLAPEPFSREFSTEYLRDTLKRSSQQIKLALLDQTKVVGLGNIYASEALHRARINPRLPAKKLSKPRIALLHREIVAVLSEAIANDNQFDTETGDLDSSYGRYSRVARVYEREGEPCLVCRAPIRRFTQGARSTYYCPQCQKR
jgi:formamidopyrimidine-DNA glycosylase